jgi:hypothetical protein
MPRVKKTEDLTEVLNNVVTEEVKETEDVEMSEVNETPVVEEVVEEVEEEVEDAGLVVVCPVDRSTRFRMMEYVNRVHQNGEAEEAETRFQCLNCHGEFYFEQLIVQQTY